MLLPSRSRADDTMPRSPCRTSVQSAAAAPQLRDFHGCCFGLQSHVTRIGRVLASRLAWRHAEDEDGVEGRVVELLFVELGKVAAPVAAGGAMEVGLTKIGMPQCNALSWPKSCSIHCHKRVFCCIA